jgi:cell division protein FtsA
LIKSANGIGAKHMSTLASGTPARPEIVAGLDIGTTKVAVVIARHIPKAFEVLGLAQSPWSGLRKGIVINVDATVETITKAKEEAELMAGIKIDSAWVGVAGSHSQSFNSKGMVAIKNGEVTQEDLRRVLEASQAVALPDDREILHILPQNFIVDSQEGIRDPLGMSGVRLEAAVHLATALKRSLQNITRCAERAGLHVAGRVLDTLAAGEACLSQDEKDLGVALVDMGGGTCDIIIYVGGFVMHTAVLPIGGTHLTKDISVGLRTPIAEAEAIKKKFGCTMTSLVEEGESIEVPSVGGRGPRTVSRAMLAEVIEPRMEEILTLINNEILKSGYQHLLGAGVVLTGGCSLLEGIVELGEFVFEMPVRRGIPLFTEGLNETVRTPVYATGVGLARHGAKHFHQAIGKKAKSVMQRFKNRFNEFVDAL